MNVHIVVTSFSECKTLLNRVLEQDERQRIYYIGLSYISHFTIGKRCERKNY